MKKFISGQSVTEYAVLVAAVAAALVAMQFYLKRGIQGRLRDLADQISATQYEQGTTESSSLVNQTGTSNQEYTSGIGNLTQDSTEVRSSNELVRPETQ